MHDRRHRRVYIAFASAAVSLVDASGVVTSAIMARRNASTLSMVAQPPAGLTSMDELTEERREKQMAKLIQICASQNDLFALDAEGVVYHYNFNTNTWMRLGGRQREQSGSPGGADGVERHLEPT